MRDVVKVCERNGGRCVYCHKVSLYLKGKLKVNQRVSETDLPSSLALFSASLR